MATRKRLSVTLHLLPVFILSDQPYMHWNVNTVSYMFRHF